MARGLTACTKLVLRMCALILASGLAALVALGDRESPRFQTWNAAENRKLAGFAFAEKTACSRVVCARDCSMNRRCASFNFHEDRKLCQLNNATKSDRLGRFMVVKGSVYFDTNKDTPSFSVPHKPRSCKTLLAANVAASGIYTIYPDDHSDEGMRVYCDMDTDGGGWIVFQRRQDGSVDFYRNWTEYQSGFGDLDGEFWLGNEQLARLTSSEDQGLVPWQLRVDLGDWQGQAAWARFDDFKIYGELYTMTFSSYDQNSTAGDSLTYHKGQAFTTKDNNNDRDGNNCAILRNGAWWFKKCDRSHLNGKYYSESDDVQTKIHGVVWDGWLGNEYSLKTCAMKMRETEL